MVVWNIVAEFFFFCGVMKYKFLATQWLRNSEINYTILQPPMLLEQEDPNETAVYNQKWNLRDQPASILTCTREALAVMLCDAACDINKGKRSTLNVWTTKYKKSKKNKGKLLDFYWSDVRYDSDSDKRRFASTNYNLPYYFFVGITITGVALTTKWLFPQRWNAVQNYTQNLWTSVRH